MWPARGVAPEQPTCSPPRSPAGHGTAAATLPQLPNPLLRVTRCTLDGRSSCGRPYVRSHALSPPLLTLLVSSNVRRGTLIFTQRVFDVPIMGSFKLLHVMLWLTAVAFLSEPGDNILRCLSLMLKATALGWPWLLQGASLCA